MLKWLMIELRAWHPDGQAVAKELFHDRLLILSSDPIEEIDLGKEACPARVISGCPDHEQFEDNDDPTAGMEEAIESLLVDVASWVDGQSTSAFEQMIQDGMEVELHCGAAVRENQYDLALPPSLLLACGKQGLRIFISTSE